MMKILYFYLSGLLLLWSSCQRPTMLDFALRYAGENRVELEKVLDHYRNDSLKYRAAVFLIGNMPYHYFYTGAQLDSLRQGYRWMQRTGLSAKAVKHKLWKTFGEPDVRRWTKRNDARFPYPAYRLCIRGVGEAALGFVLFFRRFLRICPALPD